MSAEQGMEMTQAAASDAAVATANGATNVGNAAAAAGQAAAPIVSDGAATAQRGATAASSEAQKAYNAAAPVVADAARKAADGAQQGYNAAAPIVAEGARKAGAGVVNYGGQAKDVLSGMVSQVPPMDFDADAAKSALLGGGEQGLMLAGQAATGCRSCSLDLLKLEIFRDFFQFMSIFFSTLAMPASFQTVFGTVSAVFSASLAVLLSRYASITPIAWWAIFFLLMVVCWGVLGRLVKQDLNLSLKYQATREAKAKYDWKEINMKDGKKRFKVVKYLILALTTLYVFFSRTFGTFFFLLSSFFFLQLI